MEALACLCSRQILIFIPTIDIKDRHCVRFRRGNFNEISVKLDIVKEAGNLITSGTKNIHVVDLEGSLGRPNLGVIRSVCGYVGLHARIQVGGGLRSLRMIGAYLDAGTSLVVLGTIALINPRFLLKATSEFGNRVGVGLDDNFGHIATNAWKQNSKLKTVEYLELATNYGVGIMLYTSLATDGELTGLNFVDAVEVMTKLIMPLAISGGLSSSEELKLTTKSSDWLAGILCGSAVYKKLIAPGKAIEATNLPSSKNDHKSHTLS